MHLRFDSLTRKKRERFGCGSFIIILVILVRSLSGPEDGIDPFVFSKAILLVKGERLALAPHYLRFLYARLDNKVNMYFVLLEGTM